MRYNLFGQSNDVVLLVSRILLAALFVLFGWSKITGFSGTVDYMAHVGAPAPMISPNWLCSIACRSASFSRRSPSRNSCRCSGCRTARW